MALSDLPHWLTLMRGAFRDVATAGHHSADFHFYRGGHLLLRVRIFALLFAVATPLWIPVAMWLLPGEGLFAMGVGRVVAGVAFLGVALLWPTQRSRLNGIAGLWALVIILLAFHLYAQILVGGTMAQPGLIGYTTLPLFLVACTALFPLTTLESLPLLAVIIGLEGLTVAQNRDLLGEASMGMLWVTLLMGGFALVAQAVHLYILMLLHRQASLDPLTGLLNRGALFRRIREDLTAGRGSAGPLTLVFMDLDRFKVINDHYGHPVGDEVLVYLANLINREAGPEDLVARFGGEEFLIVAPNRDLDEGMALGERIRAEVARHPIPTQGSDLAATASLGVARWDPLTQSPETLIDTVDEALYSAKEEGRNRVIRAGQAELRPAGSG
ncbi:GGDEF domain-containing protein [Thiohalorhabdus sp.]|uniref:GGDEF domain-containing protein n=1 Tax=Thiohalorhabdus sp. TaxID=3094134 RepID=UPI002FC295C3